MLNKQPVYCGDSGTKYSSERDSFIKYADGPQSLGLKAQAEWLNNLPTSVRMQFVEMLGYAWSGQSCILALRRSEMPTFASVIYDSTQSVTRSTFHLEQVLSWTTSHLYSARAETPANYKSTFLKHIKIRLSEAVELGFGEIVSAEVLSINGLDYVGPLKLIQSIDSVMGREVPFPEFFSLIHGDLHSRNILVSDDKFLLLDPRGVFPGGSTLYDPAYDFGKLLHDFLGNYTAICLGKYSLKRRSSDWQISVDQTLVARNLALLPTIEKQFYEITGISQHSLLRPMMLAGILLLTLIRFHANHRERATALALTGIVILNRTLQVLKGSLSMSQALEGPLKQL